MANSASKSHRHVCEAVSGGTPPAIASLIENAAASFELDRDASREYLFRAFSLLRAQAGRGTDRAAVMARGRLATWQVQRVIDYIEANLAGRIEAKELPRLVNLSKSLFQGDRKSTRLNSSHQIISYAVFCLKKKKNKIEFSDTK